MTRAVGSTAVDCTHIEIELHGVPALLFAQRALYLPKQQCLLIADLHLGKGETFRRAGISVPSGGTRADLARLAALIERCRPRAVFILGDMVHGSIIDESTRRLWTDFMHAHVKVEIIVIVGNHDRHLAKLSLGIPTLSARAVVDKFVLAHDPSAERAADEFLICGHLHPVVRIPGEPRRYPLFWHSEDRLVLPAFSLFTGGLAIEPRPGDHLYAVNHHHIVQVM